MARKSEKKDETVASSSVEGLNFLSFINISELSAGVRDHVGKTVMSKRLRRAREAHFESAQNPPSAACHRKEHRLTAVARLITLFAA